MSVLHTKSQKFIHKIIMLFFVGVIFSVNKIHSVQNKEFISWIKCDNVNRLKKNHKKEISSLYEVERKKHSKNKFKSLQNWQLDCLSTMLTLCDIYQQLITGIEIKSLYAKTQIMRHFYRMTCSLNLGRNYNTIDYNYLRKLCFQECGGSGWCDPTFDFANVYNKLISPIIFCKSDITMYPENEKININNDRRFFLITMTYIYRTLMEELID